MEFLIEGILLLLLIPLYEFFVDLAEDFWTEKRGTSLQKTLWLVTEILFTAAAATAVGFGILRWGKLYGKLLVVFGAGALTIEAGVWLIKWLKRRVESRQKEQALDLECWDEKEPQPLVFDIFSDNRRAENCGCYADNVAEDTAEGGTGVGALTEGAAENGENEEVAAKGDCDNGDAGFSDVKSGEDF